jgi:biopolymer transport protein TolQ
MTVAATVASEASMLNPVTLFMTADWVVKSVMVGLAVASVWSWTVIIDKAFRFTALNRQADAFEKAINSGRSLEDVAAQAGPEPSHALPRMLVIALQDWRETRRKGPLTDTEGNMLISRIDRSLDSLIAREGQRIEEGLGVLSVVATASPFIGLFGTVWGIMNAFGRIAAAGNTNLTTVAPAIAEALFATAVGLAAAIPAYIAYNKFSIDAGKFTGRLESFADDLQAAVARRLGGGSAPVAPPPPPPAAPTDLNFRRSV